MHRLYHRYQRSVHYTGLTVEWDTPTPAAVDAGTIQTDSDQQHGCKDTAFVTVSNYPKPNLGADKTVTIGCFGGTADLQGL